MCTDRNDLDLREPETVDSPRGCRKGRPSRFSLTLAEGICDRLIDGESLRTICGSEGMPAKSTVLRWADENAAFRRLYEDAREIQQRLLGDRTEVLRACLPPAATSWPKYLRAKGRLQNHLRRVGQLTPKRHVFLPFRPQNCGV